MVNPNPFSDRVNIYFTTEKPEQVTINLYNESGTIVLTNQVTAKAGSNQAKLTGLGRLASRVYIIQVKTSTGILNQRLLK